MFTKLWRWVRFRGAMRPRRESGRRDPLGPAGERRAARALKRRGYRIIARNVHVPMGEADLVCVAPDGHTHVIVEVKSRRVGDAERARRDPAPEASVTKAKQRKLRAIGRHLARANDWKTSPRIDVVAVEWPDEGRPTVRVIVGGVTGHW